MTTELWTPQGVTPIGSTPVGNNAETGSGIRKYRFEVHDDVTGRSHEFQVLVDEDTSKSEGEEMVGNAMENWLKDVRMRHNKPAPTPAQRKEIGKILDEIRIYSNKRKQSTNNIIYYSGLK